MFPLVHYAVNKKIYGQVSPLMIIGGLWPDMAVGAKVQREDGHTKCKEFFTWCKENAPDYLDLARGALSHSSEPGCVDYFADEYYPEDLVCEAKPQPGLDIMHSRFIAEKYCSEYPKGWCFVGGEKYLEEVSAATGLPDGLIWWKGHNFVEMGYELLADEQDPSMKEHILETSHDKQQIAQAAEVLAAFYNASAERIKLIYSRIPILFALKEVNAQTLAIKQRRLFIIRFNHGTANQAAMAELINRIREDLRPTYLPLLNYMAAHAAQVLSNMEHR